MIYRKEVDGLRAFAVVPVMLFHAGFSGFSGGFVGVDVFFVISGYLITSIILAEIRGGTFTVANFYERRARRILPALFLVLFACLPPAWLWLLPSDLVDFSKSLLAVSVYASNIFFWKSSNYFDTTTELKPLLHTWSLAVEEQFYIFFPLLLLWLRRLTLRNTAAVLVLAAAASLVIAQWGSVHLPSAAFYLLPTRAWELLVGAMVALYHASSTRWQPGKAAANVGAATGMVLLAYAIAFFDKSTPFPGLYALVPTLGSALIILFATDRTFTGRLLGHRLLVGIGLLSYSAYLWHQPLFSFARHWSLGEPAWPAFAGLIGFTMLLAYGSWKYVEAPFRDRTWLSQHQVFCVSVAGTLLIAAIATAGMLGKGHPERLNRYATSVIDSASDASGLTGSLDNPATVGKLAQVRTVLLGDSHADSLAEALGESFAARGESIRLLTKAGCPPVTGLRRFDIPGVGTGCHEHYARALEIATRDESIQAIVIAARFTLYLVSDRFNNGEGGVEHGDTDAVVFEDIGHEGPPRNREERQSFIASRVAQSIRLLLASGKQVYLVYPIPEAGWDAPRYGAKLAIRTASDVNLSTSTARFAERNRQAIALLDAIGEHPNLVRIRPDRALCDTFFATRCAVIVQSQSLYRDSNHLSNAGARLVAAPIAAHRFGTQ